MYQIDVFQYIYLQYLAIVMGYLRFINSLEKKNSE